METDITEGAIDEGADGVPEEVDGTVRKAGSGVWTEGLELDGAVDQVSQLDHVNLHDEEHDDVHGHGQGIRRAGHHGVNAVQGQEHVVDVEVIVKRFLDVLLRLAVVGSHFLYRINYNNRYNQTIKN